MPSSTPTAMKPIPANSCSRPSMAWRSSADALLRRDIVDVSATAAGFAAGRLVVVVVFDRFLG